MDYIFILRHYYEDYYLIDFDINLHIDVLRAMLNVLQESQNYNGLFFITHEEDREKIDKIKKLGFYYDDTLLEYARSNGNKYVCYSRYRNLDKKLTKEF